MTTKNKILNELEKNRNKFISGEELGIKLGVSRTSIWKAISSLKKEGYNIESITKKGYKLTADNDLLSEEGIRLFLNDNNKSTEIYVFDEIDSTNSSAKKYGVDGCKSGTIVVSNYQKAGRGRFGRTFYSPKGKGIYLSFIIRPSNLTIESVSFSTILTVIATIRALKKFCSQDLKVKWVNDIYIDNKKACGILTELVSDIESGGIDFIVCGIGINVNCSDEDFNDDIKDIATSICAEGISRNQIIAEISNNIVDIFDNFDKEIIISEYKSYQMLFDKEIYYEKNGINKTAIVKDISNDGGLVIESDGKIEILNSGEVSVKYKK